MATAENRLNSARYNSIICKLIPCVMVQIHQWLYKGGSRSLKDYLESEKKINKFDPLEKKLINEGVNISQMDVKLLYKLLQHTCGLSTVDEAWYKSPQSGEKLTLEKLLYKLKYYRNKASHKSPIDINKVSDGDLNKIVEELTDLFTQAYNLAGKKGHIKKKDVAVVKDQAEIKLKEERFAESCFTVSQFTEKCREEIELQSKKATLFSPDLYLQPRLLAEEKNPSTGTSRTQEIKCKDLLAYSRHDSSRPQLLILVGETGAGKSSLCGHVARTWLQCPEEMSTLAAFQLVFSLSCSELNKVNTRDLYYYLRTKLLPKTTESCTDTSEVRRLMSKVRVLWVVDGWDEATPETKELVKELLNTQPDSHTVLVTSRPEMSHELLNELPAKNTCIKLSFAELSNPEKEEIVKMNLDLKVIKDGTKLIEHFVANPDVNNPLLLVLMARLWIKNHGKGNFQISLSLVQLYTAINKQQIAELVKKYKNEVGEKRAVAIVEKYFKQVCKIAFTTISDGSILKLNHMNVQLLEKACDRVNPTHAFSTFFRFSNNPTLGGEYSFPQVSQRLFYAALHIRNVCSKAKSPESKLKELFKTCVAVNYHVNPYLGFYDIFIEIKKLSGIILSCLSCGWLFANRNHTYFSKVMNRFMKKVFNLATFTHPPDVKNQNIYYSVLLILLEMITDKSFETNITVHCLVNLLSHIIGEDANPNMCFEVLRGGNFIEELVKEISVLVNLEMWHVADRDLRAAYELLQYVTPNDLNIVISDNPDNVPDLLKTVEQVAERKVKVKLDFNWEYSQLHKKSSCEKYLDILCNQKAKCTLLTFRGHLTQVGMKHLTSASQLQTLVVRVTKEAALSSLSANAQNFHSLKFLNITYDLDQFIKPVVSLDGSVRYVKGKKIEELFRRNDQLDVYLQLPRLQNSLLKSAITFIWRLHKRYKVLNVCGLEYKNAMEFIQGLQSNGVHVANFIKPIRSKSTGNYEMFNLGSLPPKVSINDFLQPWRNIHKLTTKF